MQTRLPHPFSVSRSINCHYMSLNGAVCMFYRRHLKIFLGFKAKANGKFCDTRSKKSVEVYRVELWSLPLHFIDCDRCELETSTNHLSDSLNKFTILFFLITGSDRYRFTVKYQKSPINIYFKITLRTNL